MADPITIVGAVASIVQLIDFSTRFLVRLHEYQSKSGQLPDAFAHIASQLSLLLHILQRSRDGMNNQSISPEDAGAIGPCVQGCQDQMEELDGILSKVLPDVQEGRMKTMKKGFRSLWKESDVRKIDKQIESYVNRLTFYCAWSSSKLDPRNHDMRARLKQWLAPPDPFSNLNKALKSRSANTGKWYLQGKQYEAWKTTGYPYTWLYGSAGSGKTILSAGIVEDLQTFCRDDPARSLAIFFFDFNDVDKQDALKMVKSLISQLLDKCPGIPDALQAAYAACDDGRRQPSEHQLLNALKRTLDDIPAPFVVLDALDECGARKDLFDILAQIQSWHVTSLRVLMTSRKEIDIEEGLEKLVPVDSTTPLESHLVDQDIRTYVHERLSSDTGFRRWQTDQTMQEEIETTLGRKACGMFRWAACQLDVLVKCVTRGKVRRALQDLPKTLDETYARILQQIDKGENSEEALKILRWLAYAERPLTADELLEVTGILIDEAHTRFDEDEVLEDPRDILRICSSLVSITSGSDGANESDEVDDETANSRDASMSAPQYVRLAHFSVKEYLVSARPCVAKYSLQSDSSHDILAMCCLVYLLRFQGDEWQTPDFGSAFPLARYAAIFWTQHARLSHGGSQQRHRLSMELLNEDGLAFATWTRLFDISDRWNPMPDIHREIKVLPSPLHATSHQGVEDAVCAILDRSNANVNSQWAGEGTALQAASAEGHEKVAEMLLAKGADVNAQGGRYGNALQAALQGGHGRVVEILLAKGVDVNAQGGYYGNALQAALQGGHERVVEILLAKGADVNTRGGFYGNALQAASARGYKSVAEILLAKGADVNAQGGVYGNALQAASARGHERVVEMLLAKGAHVNAQGGRYGNALQAASKEGHEKVVEMLLARGADVNAQGGDYGNALQAESARGHEKVVEMLLAKGADVNAQGGRYGNALQAASKKGNEKVVEMLLAKDADVNAQGGRYGNALQAASARGHEKVVEMLLAKGVDVNA
ncbi:hypothetical protein B0A48_17784 [Cryoendolithus antarcticus]|uniref:Uncharacterized protein n=1 Tax=Cryoendolithus antarcticus TaxID=1507870 RepID=A0A1V8SAS3_9PEZI|nr:hypothetical protein B0A48_17784 [Cryoendolithus antarcticus]